MTWEEFMNHFERALAKALVSRGDAKSVSIKECVHPVEMQRAIDPKAIAEVIAEKMVADLLANPGPDRVLLLMPPNDFGLSGGLRVVEVRGFTVGG